MITHPVYGLIPWCSGSLIHERVFLTAGHCSRRFLQYWDAGLRLGVTLRPDVKNMTAAPADMFEVYDAFVTSGDIVDVVDVIPAPDFIVAGNNDVWPPKDRSSSVDIGVLILAEPIRSVDPIALPDPGFLDDLEELGLLKSGSDRAELVVVGYGGAMDPSPPEISFFEDRLVGTSRFQTLLKTNIMMNQNQALDEGNGGTCFGDSGGPTFWVDPETGEETLVATTSWGDMVCVAGGFAARVDVPMSLDFLQGVIAELEGE